MVSDVIGATHHLVGSSSTSQARAQARARGTGIVTGTGHRHGHGLGDLGLLLSQLLHLVLDVGAPDQGLDAEPGSRQKCFAHQAHLGHQLARGGEDQGLHLWGRE